MLKRNVLQVATILACYPKGQGQAVGCEAEVLKLGSVWTVYVTTEY